MDTLTEPEYRTLEAPTHQCSRCVRDARSFDHLYFPVFAGTEDEVRAHARTEHDTYPGCGLPCEQLPTRPGAPGVQITVRGEWYEQVIPPRCRKPRPVTRHVQTVVTIPVVASEDAPLAFTVDDRSRGVTFVRSWHEALYRPDLRHPNRASSEDENPHLTIEDEPPATITHDHYRNRSESVASDGQWAKQVHDAFPGCNASRIIIDGCWWVRTHEPRYGVQTFGMGSNHGGTSLGVYWADPNGVGPRDVFPADRHEKAREHALHVANERGDTESAARIATSDAPIEVNDPDQVRLIPALTWDAELREALNRAASDYDNAINNDRSPRAPSEEDAWEALVVARVTLAAASSAQFIPTYRETMKAPVECRPY